MIFNRSPTAELRRVPFFDDAEGFRLLRQLDVGQHERDFNRHWCRRLNHIASLSLIEIEVRFQERAKLNELPIDVGSRPDRLRNLHRLSDGREDRHVMQALVEPHIDRAIAGTERHLLNAVDCQRGSDSLNLNARRSGFRLHELAVPNDSIRVL